MTVRGGGLRYLTRKEGWVSELMVAGYVYGVREKEEVDVISVRSWRSLWVE